MDQTYVTCGIAILLGLVPAAIAQSKGKSFLLWWVFGAALFIVALPWAIIMKSDVNVVEHAALANGDQRKCPYCAELVKSEAIVCKHCGRDIPLPKPVTEYRSPDQEKTEVHKLSGRVLPSTKPVKKHRSPSQEKNEVYQFDGGLYDIFSQFLHDWHHDR